MKYTVDRIYNVVVLIGEDGERREEPRGLFPSALSEGDRVEETPEGFRVLAEETAAVKDELQARLNRLFRKNKENE